MKENIFKRNLNNELAKNTYFIAFASELFRLTESYSSKMESSLDLLASDLLIDFTKDLNIREVQFVEIFESYKKILKKLSKFNCLDCPHFDQHVKTKFN